MVVRLGVLFLWLPIEVDLVVFAGILLAIVLRRLAEWVSGLAGVSVGWALALVLVAIVLILAGIGWSFFSQQVTAQVEQLSVQGFSTDLCTKSGISGGTPLHPCPVAGGDRVPSGELRERLLTVAPLKSVVAGN